MSSRISESSFAFALTNAVVERLGSSLHGAPIFPTLLEENTAAYDVSFDEAGLPLLMQFKRCQLMRRRSAKEICHSGANLQTPFYRFELRQTASSKQHEILCGLDDGSKQVYYAVPEFHEKSQLHHIFRSGAILENSAFFRPADMGLISDSGKHTVAFEPGSDWGYRCSKPKEVPLKRFDGLIQNFENLLEYRDDVLRDQLKELTTYLIERDRSVRRYIGMRREFFTRQRSRIQTDEEKRTVFISRSHQGGMAKRLEKHPTRHPVDMTNEDERELYFLGDALSTIYGAQLVIIQKSKASSG